MLKKRLLLQKVHQIKVRTKLKFLHQRDSQILSEFISHLKALERDIEPPLTNAQRYQNLLYSMYNYLWWVLVRHNKIETTQEDLEKAARFMKLVKPAPVGIQKATLAIVFSVLATISTNQNVCWAFYLPKVESTLSKDMNAAFTTRIENNPECISTTTCQDYAKTKCYKCNQLGHLSKDCPAPRWEQANDEPLRKGSAR